MRFLSYVLHDHQYVNHVLLSTLRVERQELARVVLHGEVNEWLDKGFAIHENPGREDFIVRRRAETPDPPGLNVLSSGDRIKIDKVEYEFSIHFPFGNPSVDRSSFYFAPTALRGYALWYLESEDDQEVELEIRTCGAVILWQDGVPIVDFTPLTRNRVAVWTGKIWLPKGKSFFSLCHDDLAERDTDYYFRIALRSYSTEPRLLLPIPEFFDEDGVRRVEALFSDLRCEKECYREEQVTVTWGPIPSFMTYGTFVPRESKKNRLEQEQSVVPKRTEKNVIIRWTAGRNPFVPDEAVLRGISGAFSVSPLRENTGVGTGETESTRAELPGSEALPTGYHRLVFTADLSGVVLKRVLTVQVLNEADARCRMEWPSVGMDRIKAEGLAERKGAALHYLAKEEDASVFVAVARLAVTKGPADAFVEECLERALETAEERYDCADFQLVAVLEAFALFGERLSLALRKKMEETLLAFRYWMDEPGNDAMWFFSENHALLFHVCELVAGSLLPERRFTNSGLTGREHREKARGLIDRWFGRFFVESVTEWNSAAYLPVDVHGLTAILLLTDIADLREKAKDALDLVFRDLALYAFHGITAGTQGRSYEKELRGVYGAGTTPLLWIAFGSGALNGAGLAYLGFCLGNYGPGADLLLLMEKGDPKRGSGGLLFRKTQGHKRHVTCYLHKTPHSLLSAAINFRPGHPGYQEHVVEAAVGATARCFINHPGEATSGGSGRPSFWAGNGILPKVSQYRDLALIIFGGSTTVSGSVAVDFTHAYCPLSEFDEVSLQPRHTVLRYGDGFMGIIAAGGLNLVTTGDTAGIEFRSPGLVNAWVLVTGNRESYDSFSAFANFIGVMVESLTFASESPRHAVSIDHPAYGKVEMSMDDPMTVKGIVQEYETDTVEGVLETW